MKLLERLVTLCMFVAFVGGIPPAQTGDPVLVGAGDITSCGYTRDESTARLLDNIGGTVVTLGDNAYPDGTLTEFNNCYGPTWGRHKSRTKPAPGNHEYHTSGAGGYFTYFGSVASPLDSGCTSNCKGYYSYDLGAWHIIALNSEIDHAAGSPQERWLRSDLAAHRNVCTLAYWHKPRFSSGMHGSISGMAPFWQALYDYGADVVLNGHDHVYERFRPQNPSGQADARGIREFIVGTGGANLYSFPNILPTSQVRNNTTWGVLKLTLHATSYSWQFVPVAGQTFSDSGSEVCVGGTTATATPATSTRMHIGDLDAASTQQSGKWTAFVTVTVHDASHKLLVNATVSGAWSNGVAGTSSCTTGSNGQCRLAKSGIQNGTKSVTFTIKNIARAGYVYTSSSNHDPDGSSNGTVIIIRRP